jgi:hypothetical protein
MSYHVFGSFHPRDRDLRIAFHLLSDPSRNQTPIGSRVTLVLDCLHHRDVIGLNNNFFMRVSIQVLNSFQNPSCLGFNGFFYSLDDFGCSFNPITIILPYYPSDSPFAFTQGMSINIKFPGSLGRGSPSLNGVIVLM